MISDVLSDAAGSIRSYQRDLPDCRTQTSEPAGVTPEPCDQCGAAF